MYVLKQSERLRRSRPLAYLVGARAKVRCDQVKLWLQFAHVKTASKACRRSQGRYVARSRNCKTERAARNCSTLSWAGRVGLDAVFVHARSAEAGGDVVKKQRKSVSNVGKQRGVVRRFVATTPTGEARDDGRIDTGADMTVLSTDVACRLNASDHVDADSVDAEIPGGLVITGFQYPATIRVGHLTGRVRPYLPVSVVRPNGNREPLQQNRNLIGEDFMRDAKAKLDYGKRGTELSGLLDIDPSKFRPSTPENARYARKLLQKMCARPGARPSKRKSR